MPAASLAHDVMGGKGNSCEDYEGSGKWEAVLCSVVKCTGHRDIKFVQLQCSVKLHVISWGKLTS